MNIAQTKYISRPYVVVVFYTKGWYYSLAQTVQFQVLLCEKRFIVK